MLDKFDTAILSELQQDGRISNRDLASKVSLSNAPCWRRVRRLEQAGYIQGYVALVNAKSLGLTIVAFAEVCLDNHHAETIKGFDKVVQACPEILECHAVTGSCDYLLKIITADMEAYERFLSEILLQVSGLRAISTLFSLRQRKLSLQLPLPVAAID